MKSTAGVPLDRVDKRGVTSKGAERVPHVEQITITRTMSRSMNARLTDVGVRPRGVTRGVPRGLGEGRSGKSTVARRSRNTPHGDDPGGTQKREVRIVGFHMASAATGRLVGGEVNGVGRISTRDRRTGLKEHRSRNQLTPLVALAHDDNLGTGRVGATDDAVGEEQTTVSNPLPFGEKLSRPLKPGTDLKEDTIGLLLGRDGIDLRVDFAGDTLCSGGVAQSARKTASPSTNGGRTLTAGRDGVVGCRGGGRSRL